MRRLRWGVLAPTLFAVSAWAGPAAQAASGKVAVVAAEDFWGSIARQLGGDHAEVTSPQASAASMTSWMLSRSRRSHRAPSRPVSQAANQASVSGG